MIFLAIKSIEIKHDHLPYKDLNLNFVNGKKGVHRELLIFGRNGTGKSTIANTISDFEEYGTSEHLTFDYEEDKNKHLNFYTFSEKFVDSNIKFTENDNLNAIVMFDKQIDLEKSLEMQEARFRRLNELETVLLEKINSYNEKLEIEKVLKLLRGNGNWANRAIRFENNLKQNKKVDQKVLEEILTYKNKETLFNLNSQLKEKIDLISSLDNVNKIKEIPFYKKIDEYLKEEIINTFDKKVEINFKSDIDSNLEEIFNKFGNDHLKQLEKYLETNPHICKTCLRSLDKQYTERLLSEIKEVLLNQDIESERQRITRLIENLINEKITKKEQEKIDTQNLYKEIDKVNDLLDKIVETLRKKSKNLNEEANFDFQLYEQAISDLNSEVKKVNEQIKSHNKKIDKIDYYKQEYKNINGKIAFKEIEHAYDLFVERKKENEKDEKRYSKCKELMIKVDNKRGILNSKLMQTSLALDIINQELSLIFFDQNRLRLNDKDGFYEVLVRGNNIPLSKLSTGEKNVLSLVYFFSLLNKGKKIEELYSDNAFIVIDDPISSFDFENKIGIYNYLRKQFKLIYSKNENSQILLTTHDMEAYYNFEKVFDYIKLGDDKKITNKVNKYILSENGIKSDKNDKKGNIYNYQLQIIFDFALGNNNEIENYIGNTMRRVCEGFSTFKYKCGADSLRTNKEITSLIKNEDLECFFENYLFRLIFNNESHQADDFRGVTDKDVINYLTLDEKIKTAKLVILFLYKLDYLHIKKHINVSNNPKDLTTILNEWEDEIMNLLHS